MHAPRRFGAAQRPQELGMAGDEVRRDHAVLDQPLRTVNVAQHGLGQNGALDDGGLDRLPVRRRQDEGHDVDLPGPGLAAAIVIDVVGDAIVLRRGAGRRLAALEFLRRQLAQGAGEGAPVRPHQAAGTAQFVKARGQVHRLCDFRHCESDSPGRAW